MKDKLLYSCLNQHDFRGDLGASSKDLRANSRDIPVNKDIGTTLSREAGAHPRDLGAVREIGANVDNGATSSRDNGVQRDIGATLSRDVGASRADNGSATLSRGIIGAGRDIGATLSRNLGANRGAPSSRDMSRDSDAVSSRLGGTTTGGASETDEAYGRDVSSVGGGLLKGSSTGGIRDGTTSRPTVSYSTEISIFPRLETPPTDQLRIVEAGVDNFLKEEYRDVDKEAGGSEGYSLKEGEGYKVPTPVYPSITRSGVLTKSDIITMYCRER